MQLSACGRRPGYWAGKEGGADYRNCWILPEQRMVVVRVNRVHLCIVNVHIRWFR
jgi:hypothetical protein